MPTSQEPRIAPQQPPYPGEVASRIAAATPPGTEPLALLATIAVDERLYLKFSNSGLLDRGHLTIRQREVCIIRTSALCDAAYEYGVHAARFAEKAELDDAQLDALAARDAANLDSWSDEDRALIRACDALHAASTLDDGHWEALRATLSPAAILEILMLVGKYHTIAFITNGLRIRPESFGRPLPAGG